MTFLIIYPISWLKSRKAELQRKYFIFHYHPKQGSWLFIHCWLLIVFIISQGKLGTRFLCVNLCFLSVDSSYFFNFTRWNLIVWDLVCLISSCTEYICIFTVSSFGWHLICAQYFKKKNVFAIHSSDDMAKVFATRNTIFSPIPYYLLSFLMYWIFLSLVSTVQL